MKSWKEVKPGDIIYYYDKFKLHPQVVHSVTPREETRSYYGNPSYTYHYLDIVAGKNGKTQLSFNEYEMNYSEATKCYMPRMSCLEAAQNFMKTRSKCYKRRANYYQTQADKYTRLSKLYDLSK